MLLKYAHMQTALVLDAKFVIEYICANTAGSFLK